MSIITFVRNFLEKDITPATNTAVNLEDKLQNIYQKELAIESAISLIASAMSEVEIKTFENDVEVKGEKYYILNVEPNTNENASKFWHKAIRKMYIDDEPALIVNLQGKLYVADSYSVEEYPVRGNIYRNVRIGNLSLDKTFNSSEVILLELNNAKVKSLIDGLFQDYDDLLKTAKKSYKKNAQNKYVLELDNIKAGDVTFNEQYKEFIQKQLETFVNSEVAVYPQFKGYKLRKDEESNTNVAVNDMLEIRTDMLKLVAQAFNIPVSILMGDTTNINDMINLFLTLVIDPISDMLEEELSRKIYPGYSNFKAGNYVKVDTNNILHTDIMSVAESVDKLIACGSLNIDEVRALIGFNALNTEFSQQYWMTKNYSTADNMLNGEQDIVEEEPIIDDKGGENDE